MKLLAIDDNRDNLTALQAVVHDALPGCELLTALSGPQGLERARTDDPDVILLDIVMPGMDGFEVCRQIKADHRLRSIPVVFLTALRTDRESRLKALETGADGFLSKPLDEPELVAQVQAMAKLRAANRSQRLEKEHLATLVAERTDELERELAERRRAEEALRTSQQMIEAIIDAIPVRVFWKDKDLVFLGCNTVFARDAGFAEPKDVIGKNDYQMGWRDQAESYRAADRQVIESGCPKLLIEEPQTTPTGDTITLLTSKLPLRNARGEICGVLATCMDISGRKRAEAEKEELQAQFVQAQKMESVGRLAGGVAHDFNNLLMGIMGYTELCRDALPADHPIREWLDEISNDARRSADITRQLLAFARKQTIAPKVLDLNDALAGMLKLLRRLIGEDINLAWMPGANLWPLKLDPSQIDQILANLCVNARDAIAGVGKITIETANVVIREADCADHPGVAPGAYVLLAVSDDGCGMDHEVLAHLFEPFYTTKEVGKGTGLGLATVYGIVTQNNGFIDVHSAPGQGTTFRIHLPRFAGAAAETSVADRAEAPRGHGETVLLVEDEKSLRVTCGLFLNALGYKVLVAETPAAALARVAQHVGDIHLLLTDVVMPGMDGRRLAELVAALKPGVRALFMSGYTADVVALHGVLDPQVRFIGKPFTRDQLAHTVRQVLDSPDSSPSTATGTT